MNCPVCTTKVREYSHTEWKTDSPPEHVNWYRCPACGYKEEISREEVEFQAAAEESADKTPN